MLTGSVDSYGRLHWPSFNRFCNIQFKRWFSAIFALSSLLIVVDWSWLLHWIAGRRASRLVITVVACVSISSGSWRWICSGRVICRAAPRRRGQWRMDIGRSLGRVPPKVPSMIPMMVLVQVRGGVPSCLLLMTVMTNPIAAVPPVVIILTWSW